MRVVERVLSLLFALALIVGAVLFAVEVGWAVAGQRPLLVQWRSAYTNGRSHAWDTAPIRIAAVVLLVVGLLLLIAELKPRRPARLAMTSNTAGVDTAITRRGLRAALIRTAKQVDGISGASATVTRRKARVTATSRLGDAATAKTLTGELSSRLTSQLQALQLARTPKLRATVNPRRTARSS